ncbi:ABC transporter ATP-binding protein [Aurantimicrobium minutum]|uniref:ABC transporter ATP-binding protein n=1 Tax=Aurantimicrobium minutum TaxID=708131 RepID=UPI002473E9C8|nr:ABC transporter ATP-binding protein [Aurantimicrobium minutum]MDH6423808.1 ABC-type multidrug transport system fused ATPase/permease subunit [Aurantimicrobium minutum]
MLAAIRRSLGFLSRRERIVYFTLVAIRALSGLLDVVGIALTGLLAGLAASNLDPSKPLVILGFTLPPVSEQTLLVLVIVVLVVFAGKAVIAVSLGKAIANFLARIDSEKSAEIARYLFTGDLSRLQSLNKGEISWAVMGSTSNAFAGLLSNLSTFIAEGLLLLLVASTFILVDPVAAVFVFIYFGLIILSIQVIISRLLKKAGIDAAEGNMESLLVIDDVLGAYREITIFNKQDYFIEKFRLARSRLSYSGGTLNFLAGMPRYVVETALMLGVVIFVGYQFVTGQLASGLVTVGVFMTGGVRIMASLLPLQNAAAIAKNQVEQSEMAQRLLLDAREASLKLSEPQSSEEESIRIEVVKTQNSAETNKALQVTLSNVYFTYPGASSPALKNVSLHIDGGQHVAFIGPSGAGKTTIVDMILGLIEPTSGTVVVGNDEHLSGSLIEQGLVSYVPQNPGIVSGSIAENVALGTPVSEIDEKRVVSALEAANMSDFVLSLPEGIYSSVGSQSDALSGGQIQRLGLARALYGQPKLIVLDEATSALDASSEAFISSSLKNLGKDVTVIVIAHRLSTVQHSDTVYVVEDGTISASGTFMHLRKTVPMVAEYVKLMSFEQNPD